MKESRPRPYFALRLAFAGRCAAGDSVQMSRARVYADVNVVRPREYWDYENLAISWGCVAAGARAPEAASAAQGRP